jgi:hypothetical protein
MNVQPIGGSRSDVNVIGQIGDRERLHFPS